MTRSARSMGPSGNSGTLGRRIPAESALGEISPKAPHCQLEACPTLSGVLRLVSDTRQGKALAHRCDALIQRIARSDYGAAVTTAMVLGARFFKRVGGHVLNIVSSVVMPLLKVDYVDEVLLGTSGESEG